MASPPRTLPAEFFAGVQPPKTLPADFGFRPADQVPGVAEQLRRALLIPTTALGRGFGRSLLGVPAVLEPVGARLGVPAIERAGRRARQFSEEFLAEAPAGLGMEELRGRRIGDEPALLADPAYMSTLAMEGVGSVLGFFLPGSAVGRGAAASLGAAMPKLMASRPVLGRAAQWLAGTAAGSAMESLVNATDNYTTAIEEYGADPEVAQEVFAQTLKKDFALTGVTNLFGLYSPRLKPTWAKLVLGISDAYLEGAQELFQGEIAHRVLQEQTGQQIPRAGRAEEFLGGLLGGGLVSAGRAAIDRPGRRAPAPELGARLPAPAAAETQAAAPLEETEARRFLPRELAGAKPRYKLFDLEFASDIDKAAFITAQTRKSKRDADYMAFVQRATGLSASGVRDMGARIRSTIGRLAVHHQPSEGPLFVPEQMEKGERRDTQDIERLPSGEPQGQAAIQAEPQPPAGREAAGPSRVLQEEEIAGELPRAPVIGIEEARARTFEQRLAATARAAEEEFAEGVGARRPPIEPAGPRLVETTPAAPVEEVAAAAPARPAARPAAEIPGERLGNRAPAKTARGTEVETQYAVVDAFDLVASHDLALNENPAYPAELQPRDRTRAASEAQIGAIAQGLDPRKLGESIKASEGAPIVGPDLLVESGNGRTIAIQRLYRQQHPNAARYRDWLGQNARRFGIAAEQLAGVNHPVLVRIRRSDMDRVQFAREANEQTVAAMSATEMARSDAARLSSGTLALFQESDTGEIAIAANRDFIRAFFEEAIAPAERGSYQLPDGSLSQAGVTRIRNAVFAKAYGETGAVEKLAEATESNVRNITAGMLRAAPKFVALAEAIAAGERHEVNIAPDVAAAARKLSELREQRGNIGDYLNQATLFGDDLSPEARELLHLYDVYGRSQRLIGDILGTYIEAANTLGSPRQAGLFGGKIIPSRGELLAAAVDIVEQQETERKERERQKKNVQASLFEDTALRRGEDQGEAARAAPAAPIPQPGPAAEPAGGLTIDQLAADARARLDARGTLRGERLPAGLPMDDLADLTVIGAAKFAGGARRFTAWSRDMAAELGARIKPHLLRIWREVRRFVSEESGEADMTRLGELIRTAGQAVGRGAATFASTLRPGGARIAEAGPAGVRLRALIDRARDLGETRAGQRLARLMDTGLHKFSDEEAFQLVDMLEGRADPTSDRVDSAFNTVRDLTDEVAAEAVATNVKKKRTILLTPAHLRFPGLTTRQRERLTAGQSFLATVRMPFEPRANYFPHVILDADQLRAGRLREQVITNMVDHLGVATDRGDAAAMINEYVAYLERGGRAERLVAHLIATGQAGSEEEARAKLARFRQRTLKRSGALEYGQEVDLPFWDPDPRRVLPRHLSSTALRLARIQTFGQDDQRVKRLLGDIAAAGGPRAEDAARAVDRVLNYINEPQTAEAKLVRFAMALQTIKLSLSQIPNATQGALNTMFAADLPAVAAGFRGILTRRGRRFGVESGATLESVLRETARAAGADSEALRLYLKATGFTPTEQMNRVFAANAGADYAGRLARRLHRNPANRRARRMLGELGLNAELVARTGRLSPADVLIAAKRFSDLTQFRSQPQDVPLLASTTGGRMFFQFKSFIYGQTRLLATELSGNVADRDWLRAARNLLVLGILFPLTGEAIASIRSLITGRKRDMAGLERYLDGAAQVGALGAFLELAQSGWMARGVEMLAGPAVTSAGDLLNVMRAKDKPKAFAKWSLRQFGGAGSAAANRLFPPRRAAPAELPGLPDPLAEMRRQERRAVGAAR